MTNKRFKVFKVSGNFGEWEVEDTVEDTVVMDRIIHKYLADKLCDKLNELNNENTRIKQTILEAYETERTQIGQNVLKQLLNNI